MPRTLRVCSCGELILSSSAATAHRRRMHKVPLKAATPNEIRAALLPTGRQMEEIKQKVFLQSGVILTSKTVREHNSRIRSGRLG